MYIQISIHILFDFRNRKCITINKKREVVKKSTYSTINRKHEQRVINIIIIYNIFI